MKDGTKMTRAFVRSELYRGSHRVEATPARPQRTPVGHERETRAGAALQRARRVASSPLSLVGLLGLLDLLKGG